MRIAAIIPSYNRSHVIERALDSVLAQNSPVDEIIVVDDGSDDDTAELIKASYPTVRLIQQDNRGVSAARNTAIGAATSEWVALLDSDDEWLPDKITEMRKAHRQQPEINLLHSDEIWIRNGVRVNAMDKHKKSGGWIFPDCLPLCAISPSASVIRRQTLIDEGLFDENLPACEDYDMWLKICRHQPVLFIKQPLITKHGGHADQLSRAFIAMDQFRILALDRLLKRNCLTPEYEQLARDTLLRKLKILVSGAHKHKNTELIERFEPLQQFWQQAIAC